MKKFLIERDLPGAGNLSKEDLKGISQKSCQVVNDLNKPYHWVETFVTDDKLYCIHIAEDEETVRQHAILGGFPANKISEVKSMMDPTTSV